MGRGGYDEQGRPILDSYARMSDGFDGKEINVEEQFKRNDGVIGARGGVLGMRMSDPLSAWKPNVCRKEWELLVHRIETGQTAGAAIYNIDRFLRQNVELEKLFGIVKGLNAILLSPGSEWDLDNEDHRLQLRMLVSFANKSSADTQRRVKDKLRAMRERGILAGSGARCFAWPGYVPLKPGQKRRRWVSEELLQREVEALQWAFEVFAAGEKNLTEIAQAWNDAALLGFYGRPWRNITVRQVLGHQRFAGRIEHAAVDRQGKRGRSVVVAQIADHEPTIDPELFDRVQAKLQGRKRGRPVSGKHLASGLVLCGVCGFPLMSRPRYRGGDPARGAIPTYRCLKGTKEGRCGSVQIDQEPVDAFIAEWVVDRLSDPAVAGQVVVAQMEAYTEAAAIEAELEQIATTQAALSDKLGAGGMEWEHFNVPYTRLQTRTATLTAKLDELRAATADENVVRTAGADELRRTWDTSTVLQRRELLRAATRTAQLRVLPAGPLNARFAPRERLEVVVG